MLGPPSTAWELAGVGLLLDFPRKAISLFRLSFNLKTPCFRVNMLPDNPINSFFPLCLYRRNDPGA
jgi:hypothetical protein